MPSIEVPDPVGDQEADVPGLQEVLYVLLLGAYIAPPLKGIGVRENRAKSWKILNLVRVKNVKIRTHRIGRRFRKMWSF